MDKHVLVTGASRGIGAATALTLGRQGYKVCINYLQDEQSAVAVAKTIQNAGGSAWVKQADVSNASGVNALFEAIDQAQPLTHLVNNAGTLFPQAPLSEITETQLHQVFATNVFSYFMCTREALARLPSGGAIVNVSSVAARTGSPFEYVDYAATKAAIDTLTKGASVEAAEKGIRVNAVRPGFIHTEIHQSGGEPGRIERLASALPLKRGGRPEEVASAIAYLLSEEAAYITGAILDIAGGV